MLFMVVERFKDGKAKEIYRRFQEKGRMMPEGLKYLDSWVEVNFDQGLSGLKSLLQTLNLFMPRYLPFLCEAAPNPFNFFLSLCPLRFVLSAKEQRDRVQRIIFNTQCPKLKDD